MEDEIKNRLLSILNKEIDNNFGSDEMPESYAIAIKPDFSDMLFASMADTLGMKMLQAGVW